MTDWLLRQLADQLGVAPAQPGEATTPRLRFDQPWAPQWLFVLILFGSAALIIWLYWHEGKASRASKLLLAGLRMSLVLLAMFMLSEAVLSVERKGLPYLDDSGRRLGEPAHRRPVRESRGQEAQLDSLAAPAKADQTTRLAIAKGLILKDRSKLLRDLEAKHKVRIYLVSNSAQLLTKIDRPTDIPGSRDEVAGRSKPPAASRGWATASGTCSPNCAEPLQQPIVLLSDGQTTEGESALEGSRARREKGSADLRNRLGLCRARPRHRADRAPGRRRRVRR